MVSTKSSLRWGFDIPAAAAAAAAALMSPAALSVDRANQRMACAQISASVAFAVSEHLHTAPGGKTQTSLANTDSIVVNKWWTAF